MNTKRRLAIGVGVLLSQFVLSGCTLISNELTRGEARSQLRDYFQEEMFQFGGIFFKMESEFSISKRCQRDPMDCFFKIPVNEDLKPLYDAGYLQYGVTYLHDDSYTYNHYSARFTLKSIEKIKTFVQNDNQIVLYELGDLEVTGILSDIEKSEAVAEFTIQIEPNELGRVSGRPPKSQASKAFFKKYDDGWRLMKLSDSWTLVERSQ